MNTDITTRNVTEAARAFIKESEQAVSSPNCLSDNSRLRVLLAQANEILDVLLTDRESVIGHMKYISTVLTELHDKAEGVQDTLETYMKQNNVKQGGQR
jgi:hypothetical protein